MAVLTYNYSEKQVKLLFSRNSWHLLPANVLFPYFVIYFCFAAYCSGTMIASGIVIPTLVAGALLGRLWGVGLGVILDHAGLDHKAIDPGAFAFLGAAALFAGVSRLTISLTVIMIELTNDLPHLLPTMASVIAAKVVADCLVHPLYHALLQVFCVPFLNTEPGVTKLSLFTVKTVMSHPVVCLLKEETVHRIVEVLNSTTHNCFPVVHSQESMALYGTISRYHLEILLSQPTAQLLQHSPDCGEDDELLTYEQILAHKQRCYLVPEEHRAPKMSQEADKLVLDLGPYISNSPFTVQDNFALSNALSMFRALRLRHMVVLDGHKVIGIVTRKDLLGHNLERSVKNQIRRGTKGSWDSFSDSGRSYFDTPREVSETYYGT
uniref:Chloride channel protein n=1 Tax=Eutreptiella gymnastica TaxID=73025 RepID=A0A7S4CHJ9_9EUGL